MGRAIRCGLGGASSSGCHPGQSTPPRLRVGDDAEHFPHQVGGGHRGDAGGVVTGRHLADIAAHQMLALQRIKRSSPLFDEIIIAVLNNPDKNPLFSVEERCAMISELVPLAANGQCRLIVESFSGLTADFAKEKQATAIVRGIRAVSDYEYELRMALMNRRLEPNIETVFLMAAEEYSYVSSDLMKQVFRLGGRVEGLIPELVEAKMREKLG